MTEQKVNPDGKPLDQGGQVQTGNLGQQVVTQQATGGQPPSDETIVELPGGEKVAYGELKKQRMMEADYRQKTAALAEEKRRLEADKSRIEQSRRQPPTVPGPEAYNEDGEVDPIQILAERIGRMEAVTASQYLNSEIGRLSSKYPDADKETVFKACWNNPQANIEEEMQKDHERIVSVKTSNQSQLLTPERELELKKKAVEEYLAKKKQAAGIGTGFATGEGSQTVVDPQTIPENYDGCKAKLAKELEAPDLD